MKFILIFYLVVLVCLLLSKLPPLTIQDKADRAYNRWLERRKAQGYTGDEIRCEAAVREELARLRQVCSDFVYTNTDPEKTWEDAKRLQVDVSAYCLNVLNPKWAKTYLAIVRTLNPRDILYPDALDKLGMIPKPDPSWPKGLSDEDAMIKLAAFTDL